MITFASVALITHFWPAWLSWLALFCVYEFSALALRKKYPDTNSNGGTLSELVWWLIRGSSWWHHLLYGTFLLFFIDLGCHFFVGTALLPFLS